MLGKSQERKSLSIVHAQWKGGIEVVNKLGGMNIVTVLALLIQGPKSHSISIREL